VIADNAGLRDPLGDAFEDLQAYFEQRVHVREEAAELLCETQRRAGGHVDATRAGGDRRRMWLFAIAANVLADHHRAHRRRSRRTGRGQATLTDSAPGAAATESQAVRVAGLPRRQREALVLRFWMDLPVAAIADATGVRMGTVKSQISRGLAVVGAALREGAER
jgi:RNA polymerase sigma-70 factor (ECF subfamily)